MHSDLWQILIIAYIKDYGKVTWSIKKTVHIIAEIQLLQTSYLCERIKIQLLDYFLNEFPSLNCIMFK